MTQADGVLPNSSEMRGVLGRMKIVYGEYELALTRAAAQMDRQRPAVQHELMAMVSLAHAECVANLRVVGVSLGLPYDRIIDLSSDDFEEMPDGQSVRTGDYW